MELDEQAQIISYEEYHPYGSTSYQAGRSADRGSLKRYRYTGKERDEETGLNYHGARYYAAWLGRWTSTDPIGIGDGLNLYLMARNNPTRHIDVSGMDNTETTYVTPRVRADLKAANIKYAEQVVFDLLDSSGKVKATGRFDLGVSRPASRSQRPSIIPELKGKNINELHSNQHDYLPELESKGGTIRIRSTKTSSIDLAKNAEFRLHPEDFFRVGTGNLEDFSSALREVAGGKPITNKWVGKNGEVKVFTSEVEAHEFFRSQGIEPTKVKVQSAATPKPTPPKPTVNEGSVTKVAPTLSEPVEPPRTVKLYSMAPGQPSLIRHRVLEVQPCLLSRQWGRICWKKEPVRWAPVTPWRSRSASGVRSEPGLFWVVQQASPKEVLAQFLVPSLAE